MDRRSWPWRRKLPEKIPGSETESSESLSSHSERFSGDQTLSNLNTQSAEVRSKAAPGNEHEVSDTVKALSEKLSDALVNIRAKDDLVKQHAKVAEEAISGWERAENEALVLKKQNDNLTHKNSILEERVGHLDGALKECLRQLRRAREEQEERIQNAIMKNSSEWESQKSDFEKQLVELHTQLQNAKTEANNAGLVDVLSRLEAAENENVALKAELLSKTEELELRTSERDLSTQAAETASKQHLDGAKKMAKLEAECRGLKVAIRKANHRSVTYVESSAESLLDSAVVTENDGGKTTGSESIDSELCCSDTWSPLTRSAFVPPVGIDLMNDFLEMERLAALPGTASRDEVEAMINRVAELEENLAKIKAEKEDLETELNKSQIQLQESKDQLKQTEVKLVELKTQLVLANEAKRNAREEIELTKAELQSTTNRLCEAEANVAAIQDHLVKANEAKIKLMEELTDATRKKEEAESQLKVMDCELETLRLSLSTSRKELENKRKISGEAATKGDRLEAKISRMRIDFQYPRSAEVDEFRNHQDEELAAAASKFAECQKTIASLGLQLKSLATFEDFMIDSERSVSVR